MPHGPSLFFRPVLSHTAPSTTQPSQSTSQYPRLPKTPSLHSTFRGTFQKYVKEKYAFLFYAYSTLNIRCHEETNTDTYIPVVNVHISQVCLEQDTLPQTYVTPWLHLQRATTFSEQFCHLERRSSKLRKRKVHVQQLYNKNNE